MSNRKHKISSVRTIRKFLSIGTCSGALCNAIDYGFGHPLKLEEEATTPLAGGIMQHGYQCGALWGAALGAGAEAYRRFGSGSEAEAAAILASQKLVESMNTHFKEFNCAELTGTNWKKPSTVVKYFIKGGTIKCFGLVAKYANLAFDEINTAFLEEKITAPSPPVSCASMVARKMGVSDKHAVMAAGLAGGIGLSGGGCGALGAAIWITSMGILNKPKGRLGFSNSENSDVIDRYLKASDYEFECADVVGRKFENVGDHAEYMGNKGCLDIIDALASQYRKGAE